MTSAKEESIEIDNEYLQQLENERAGLGEPYSNAVSLLEREINRVKAGGKKDDGKSSDSSQNEKHRYADHWHMDLTTMKPQKAIEKVAIPVEKYPKFNFVGKLLGPRGATMRQLEQETQTKLSIYGKGSIRDKAKEEELLKQGGKFSHLKEKLHVHIEAFADPSEAHSRIAHALAELRKFMTPTEEELRQLSSGGGFESGYGGGFNESGGPGGRGGRFQENGGRGRGRGRGGDRGRGVADRGRGGGGGADRGRGGGGPGGRGGGAGDFGGRGGRGGMPGGRGGRGGSGRGRGSERGFDEGFSQGGYNQPEFDEAPPAPRRDFGNARGGADDSYSGGFSGNNYSMNMSSDFNNGSDRGGYGASDYSRGGGYGDSYASGAGAGAGGQSGDNYSSRGPNDSYDNPYGGSGGFGGPRQSSTPRGNVSGMRAGGGGGGAGEEYGRGRGAGDFGDQRGGGYKASAERGGGRSDFRSHPYAR